MSVALFIVPERDVPGLDVFVNGKALAHCDGLDDLAERASVRPLMDFFSQDPAEAEAFLELEDIEPPTEGLDPVEWHPAEEGLATVCGLLSYLEANPGAIPRAEAVIDDLRGFQEVLGALASEGVRWHLAVDL